MGVGCGSGRGDVDCGPVMDNGILLRRNRRFLTRTHPFCVLTKYLL